MKTEIVHFRRDSAHSLLPSDGVPGEQADGSVICAIDECPDTLVAEKLLNRLQGLFPAPGMTRVSFADLPVRDRGCCGGRCGG